MGGSRGTAFSVFGSSMGDCGVNISLVDPTVLVSSTENLLVEWGVGFTIDLPENPSPSSLTLWLAWPFWKSPSHPLLLPQPWPQGFLFPFWLKWLAESFASKALCRHVRGGWVHHSYSRCTSWARVSSGQYQWAQRWMACGWLLGFVYGGSVSEKSVFGSGELTDLAL